MDHLINELTILSGTNRSGEKEGFDKIVIRPGDTLAIVGPTGSGKSAFINDIEVLAQADTVTGRKILLNGRIPPDDVIRNPAKKPIAMITQNTQCIADLPVERFLSLHITARGRDPAGLVSKTISLANQFTGELMYPDMRMTSLSGGQSRSLMIADAIVIGKTPILLLDEIENAGIFKDRVIACIKDYDKAVLFVTHDPYLAMITDRRIVMRNGAVACVIDPSGAEHKTVEKIGEIESFLSVIRERIRSGDLILEQQNPVPEREKVVV